MSKLAFNKPQLKSLTGLRFFAAIYIVLFHHGGALCIFGTSVCNLISYGYVSVSLFFVLSGFVLAYVYLNSENIQPIKKKRFWIARFARIYPLYLLSLLVSIPSFASKFEYFSCSFITTLKGLCSAFLSSILLQSWTPWTSTIFNTPTWAVSNEAFFYFVFPFIAIPIARLSKRKLIVLVTLLWILAILPPMYLSNLFKVRNFTQFLGRSLFSPFSFAGLLFPFFAYSPWFHLPQFLIGVCAGLLFSRKEGWTFKSTIPLIGIPIIGCLCLLIYNIFAIDPNTHYLFLNNGLLAPLFCILIYYLAEGKGWLPTFFASPKILILGEASYAIYLFQNPLLSFLKRLSMILLGSNGISTSFFDIIFLGVYFFVLILFSVFVTYTIENPVRRIIVNKFNK